MLYNPTNNQIITFGEIPIDNNSNNINKNNNNQQ